MRAAELKKLLKDPEKWRDTKATYDEMLTSLKASRQELVEEYDKYKSVTDAVDKHIGILDLTAYGRPAPDGDAITIDLLFPDEWENQLAHRYLAERSQVSRPLSQQVTLSKRENGDE
jgi:hypothetical protein